ncbi:MAG: arylsulfatase, partial [Planctomycetota bacterium]|nr:arylsulfatase [Planctomycetota bacterium]
NLNSDAGESNNVAAAHPDVVQRLQAIAAMTENDLGTDGIGPGCRKLGRVESPKPLIEKDGTVRADAVGNVKVLP